MLHILYDIILSEPSTFFYASCDLWLCNLVTLTLTLVLKIERKIEKKIKMKKKNWKELSLSSLALTMVSTLLYLTYPTCYSYVIIISFFLNFLCSFLSYNIITVTVIAIMLLSYFVIVVTVISLSLIQVLIRKTKNKIK